MKLYKIVLASIAAVASVGLLSSAQATPITGMLNISGTAHYNAPIATATQVTMFEDVITGGANTGSFAGIPSLVPVTMTSPYIFNPSTPTPALWSVAGFTFDLLSSVIIFQSSHGILLEGEGIITGNGFDPTSGHWSTARCRHNFDLLGDHRGSPGWRDDHGSARRRTDGTCSVSREVRESLTTFRLSRPRKTRAGPKTLLGFAFCLEFAGRIPGPWTDSSGRPSPLCARLSSANLGA